MNGLPKSLASRGGEKAETSRHDQADIAAYIVEMTAELARLAGEAGLPMLAYFLNLACVEAQITAREGDLPALRRGL